MPVPLIALFLALSQAAHRQVVIREPRIPVFEEGRIPIDGGIVTNDNWITIYEPPTPSRTRTHLQIECAGRPISVRWTAAHPGRHEIEEITVDGIPVAQDQFPILTRFVANRGIENIGVERCGMQNGHYAARLRIEFGGCSADPADSPRIVQMDVSRGLVTIRR